MMYGLPDTTFIAITGIPIAIGIALLLWGMFYKPGDEE